ncbi:hypothetical protein Syun_010661 [Stephania yunnanensis]|uniref:Uncharacterized protein n=1 Tax=Stephania yunnanensis TaxID=152371 RepID=A0AAP0KGX7_9MAGN
MGKLLGFASHACIPIFIMLLMSPSLCPLMAESRVIHDFSFFSGTAAGRILKDRQPVVIRPPFPNPRQIIHR